MLKSILVCVLLIATMGLASGHNRERSNSPTVSWTSIGTGVSSGKVSTVTPPRKRPYHHVRTRHKHPSVPTVLPKESGALVTVPTAAGISITVARKLAPQFQGFVADLVNIGYTPKHIGCWASGGHVANSNHYHGGACDFDQTGWGQTAATMHHVRNLAAKWNLRDGCTFHRADCGHIDDGTNIHWQHPNNLIARYIDYQTSSRTQYKVLDNFEGGM